MTAPSDKGTLQKSDIAQGRQRISIPVFQPQLDNPIGLVLYV